jgi:hypothetical protein
MSPAFDWKLNPEISHKKGAKDLQILREESVTAASCCNAEEQLLPYSLFWEVLIRNENLETILYMDLNYIRILSTSTSIWCFLWNGFRSNYFRDSRQINAPLILDGLTSYCKAQENKLIHLSDSCDVTILWWPSHKVRSSATGPVVSKPLKSCYKQEAMLWIRNHKEGTITR